MRTRSWYFTRLFCVGADGGSIYYFSCCCLCSRFPVLVVHIFNSIYHFVAYSRVDFRSECHVFFLHSPGTLRVNLPFRLVSEIAPIILWCFFSRNTSWSLVCLNIIFQSDIDSKYLLQVSFPCLNCYSFVLCRIRSVTFKSFLFRGWLLDPWAIILLLPSSENHTYFIRAWHQQWLKQDYSIHSRGCSYNC